MRFLFLLLTLFSSLSFAGNQVFTYGPSVVDLTGHLDLQTFPGPPNYESIGAGDKIERYFYLKLDQPIDVQPKKENVGIENAEPEKNVKVIQLSIAADDDGLWGKFRKLGKGAHVKIQGTLFHRFTGHHHSRVLMIATSVHAVEKK
jgi:hypothetical protein